MFKKTNLIISAIGVVLFLLLTVWLTSTETEATTSIQHPPTPPMPQIIVKNIPYGECRITAYCSCYECCGEWALNRPDGVVYGASGNELTSGVSVASNLPFGTQITIEGYDGLFTVEDRAAQWIHDKYDGMYVDIYFSDHAECWDYIIGKPEWSNVYIREVIRIED